MENADKWLRENATMYRGDNASECMLAAFKAGMKSVTGIYTVIWEEDTSDNATVELFTDKSDAIGRAKRQFNSITYPDKEEYEEYENDDYIYMSDYEYNDGNNVGRITVTELELDKGKP